MISIQLRVLLFFIVAAWLAACSDPSPEAPVADAGSRAESVDAVSDSRALNYPSTKTVDAADTYHDTHVADPYRWLEQDVRQSAEVAHWMAGQNELTDAYLEDLPMRARFDARLAALWDYERFGLPIKRGGMYFFPRGRRPHP